MSFFQNTCKPKGLGGSLMVNMMNIGHSPMAEWGLKHIKINKNDISLDVGCGGGANIKKLLEKSPKGYENHACSQQIIMYHRRYG